MSDYDIISPDFDEYRKIVTPEILDFPGSVFYEPNFIKTISDFQNLSFNPLIALSGNKVVGLVNQLVNNRFGVKISAIPRLIQYYGPVVLNDDSKAYESLISRIATCGNDLCIYSIPNEMNDMYDYSSWKRVSRLTYYLKTNKYEEVFKNCSKGCKNKINKAKRNSVEIVESDNIPLEIYQETFDRRKMKPPINLNILKNWLDKLYELGLLRIFIARYNSNSVAFRSVLYYGRYAYNWISGVKPEAFNLGAGNLLMITTTERLFNAGIERIDLVGGDIKSIAEFKKSFGSLPVKHFQFERAFTLKGKIYRALMKLRANLDE